MPILNPGPHAPRALDRERPLKLDEHDHVRITFIVTEFERFVRQSLFAF